MAINYIYPVTIGASNPAEDNDCVVRAVANVTGKPYHDIWAVADALGRKPKHGMNMEQMVSLFGTYNLQPIMVNPKTRLGNQLIYNNLVKALEKGMTLGTLCKTITRGNYIAIIQNSKPGSCHALAITDGKIIDLWANKGTARICAVWKL